MLVCNFEQKLIWACFLESIFHLESVVNENRWIFITYLTLPTCRVNVDVGDNVTSFLSVLCRPDDFSKAAASQQRLDIVIELHSLSSSWSCFFDGT